MNITQSDFFYTDYLFDGPNVRNAVKFTSKSDPGISYTFPVIGHWDAETIEQLLGPVFIDIANKSIALKAEQARAQREALPDAKEEFPLS